MGMKIKLGIAFTLLVFFSNAYCTADQDNIRGAWQPSYAFNGKIPWFNGTIIIQSDIVYFETEGKVYAKWLIKSSKRQLSIKDGVQKKLLALKVQRDQNLQLFVFEINQKYGCKPKSRLKKDPDCKQHDSRARFRLRICEDPEHSLKNIASCNIKERYFQFDDQLLKKLNKMSSNM